MVVPVPDRFLIFLAVLCILPAASAFTISSVSTDPAGDAVPNAAITVTIDMPFRDVGVYEQIVLSTDLIEPVWDARVITKEKESPIVSAFANGNTLTIPGAVFNPERGTTGSVRILLKGYVPENPTPGQDIVHIRQLDADGIEYAYPSGYILPMATPATPVTTVTGTITERPVANDSSVGEEPTPSSFGDLIGSEPTAQSFGDLIGATTTSTPVQSRKGTPVVPTPWMSEPMPTAAPVDPLVVLGSVSLALYAMRR